MTIFEKVKLNNLVLANRLGVPAMTTRMAKDGWVNEDHLITYGMYARNKFGMIIVEATAVSENGKIFPEDLAIHDDKYIKGLNYLSRVIKKHGSIAAIQLSHAGRRHFNYDNLWSPSALSYNQEPTRAMTLNEIEVVKADFVAAAQRAEKAGFDIVELHAAHGYLLHQFLSPLSNNRTDCYGGSLDNRARLLTEIVDEIKAACNIEVIVRISAVDYDSGGNTIDDMATVVSYLRQRGVHFIDVSSGGITKGDNVLTYPGYQVEYSAKIKEGNDVLVSTVGELNDINHMEKIVAEGLSDFIFVGRYTISNPTWLMKEQKNKIKQFYYQTILN